MTSSISVLTKRATVETTNTERTSEGNTECHQLSKNAIGKSPSFSPSQYCKTGPSTKVGTDTPITAIITARVSQMVLCGRAATMPSASPTTIPKMTAWTPMNMETGKRDRIICDTGLSSK